jgi:hypothetical protein
MPDLTCYYADMEALLIDVGRYVKINALLEDIRYGERASPDSKIVLQEEFDGDRNKLGCAVNSLYKKAPRRWSYIRQRLKENGTYNEEDAIEFTRLIQRRECDGNFRDMALKWTQTQLRKLNENKQVEFYDLHDYLTSYNYYLLEKRKEKGRHFKGLHKSA